MAEPAEETINIERPILRVRLSYDYHNVLDLYWPVTRDFRGWVRKSTSCVFYFLASREHGNRRPPFSGRFQGSNAYGRVTLLDERVSGKFCDESIQIGVVIKPPILMIILILLLIFRIRDS